MPVVEILKEIALNLLIDFARMAIFYHINPIDTKAWEIFVSFDIFFNFSVHCVKVFITEVFYLVA